MFQLVITNKDITFMDKYIARVYSIVLSQHCFRILTHNTVF